MSFSSAPDKATLGRVAGALAVDEAFVEKDWYVVQAISRLVGLATSDLTPVFSGGTSLLKAYGLIKRFSEDIDFKLALSADFTSKTRNQQRKALGIFRDALIAEWKAAGFEITSVEARDANGFIKVEMDYPSKLPPHGSLRPHILAEISAKPPRLPVQERAVASFVSQFKGQEPELPSVSCLDPVETAADKLSAFAWRMLLRDREDEKDDAAIVRHLHDLAALEEAASNGSAFPALLETILEDDRQRGGKAVAELTLKERLAAMRAKLKDDKLYADEYALFVGGMAFAGAGDVPSFELAAAALGRLCDRLPS